MILNIGRWQITIVKKSVIIYKDIMGVYVDLSLLPKRSIKKLLKHIKKRHMGDTPQGNEKAGSYRVKMIKELRSHIKEIYGDVPLLKESKEVVDKFLNI